jgi:uncharacterized flavoprotein (TIGR03862 family)
MHGSSQAMSSRSWSSDPDGYNLNPPHRPHVAVIGAGPAGLMATEVLAAGGAAVTLYDRMPSVGRKFLMAGRGGLNLTHSEPLEKFLTRYSHRADALRPAIDAFSPAELRAWSQTLGQETFVGSSGRVFPKAMKASPLLRNWLGRLRAIDVTFALRHRWVGWDENGGLLFETPNGEVTARADAVVLALGGASWPKLGSTGDWVNVLAQAGVNIVPLRAANCGFTIAWSEIFRNRFEGHPLKRVGLTHGDTSLRGEAMITREGIEGGAVYALSAQLREAIDAAGETVLSVDLLPDLSSPDLAKKLAAPRGKQSLATFLRKAANLSPVAIGLLHETAETSPVTLPPADLARLIKAIPLRLRGVAPVTRAISTAGGIAFDELDADFMLRKIPGVFVAGEMLDWEAPTGGYLLQASFATGAAAGRGALDWLSRGRQVEIRAGTWL